MRHILEEEERRKMEPDLVPSGQRSTGVNNDPYELLKAGRIIFQLKRNIYSFVKILSILIQIKCQPMMNAPKKFSIKFLTNTVKVFCFYNHRSENQDFFEQLTPFSDYCLIFNRHFASSSTDRKNRLRYCVILRNQLRLAQI